MAMSKHKLEEIIWVKYLDDLVTWSPCQLCFTISSRVTRTQTKQSVLLQALHLCFVILSQIFQSVQFIKFYRVQILFEGNIVFIYIRKN